MNGIFHYQVPGQASRLNTSQEKSAGQISSGEQVVFNQQLSTVPADTKQQVTAAFLKLWQQLLFHRKEQKVSTPVQIDKPVSDVSTHSLGEEEGQPIAAPAYTHPGKLLKAPEATTLLMGEEDGGAVGEPLGGVTTFALGEEEGATPPMIKVVTPEGKVVMTTQAFGEEESFSSM